MAIAVATHSAHQEKKTKSFRNQTHCVTCNLESVGTGNDTKENVPLHHRSVGGEGEKTRKEEKSSGPPPSGAVGCTTLQRTVGRFWRCRAPLRSRQRLTSLEKRGQ